MLLSPSQSSYTGQRCNYGYLLIDSVATPRCYVTSLLHAHKLWYGIRGQSLHLAVKLFAIRIGLMFASCKRWSRAKAGYRTSWWLVKDFTGWLRRHRSLSVRFIGNIYHSSYFARPFATWSWLLASLLAFAGIEIKGIYKWLSTHWHTSGT